MNIKKSFDITGKIETLICGEGDLPTVIGGYASLNTVDKESHILTLNALKNATAKFLSNSNFCNLMYEHSSIQIGQIVPEYNVNGKTYTTHVDEKGLFVVGILRTDSDKVNEVRKLIKSKELGAFSIRGKASNVTPIIENGIVCLSIDELELLEVTACKNGKHPDAGFEVLKGIDVNENNDDNKNWMVGSMDIYKNNETNEVYIDGDESNSNAIFIRDIIKTLDLSKGSEVHFNERLKDLLKLEDNGLEKVDISLNNVIKNKDSESINSITVKELVKSISDQLMENSEPIDTIDITDLTKSISNQLKEDLKDTLSIKGINDKDGKEGKEEVKGETEEEETQEGEGAGLDKIKKIDYEFDEKEKQAARKSNKLIKGCSTTFGIAKGKVYIHQGEQAPKGSSVGVGPRGGKYYESTGDKKDGLKYVDTGSFKMTGSAHVELPKVERVINDNKDKDESEILKIVKKFINENYTGHLQDQLMENVNKLIDKNIND